MLAAVTLRKVKAEGWYLDPYGVHTERWYSNGEPTSLVRDEGGESRDPPPEGQAPGPLVEAEVPKASRVNDLRRADEQESSSLAADLRRADESPEDESFGDAALDAGAESGAGFD